MLRTPTSPVYTPVRGNRQQDTNSLDPSVGTSSVGHSNQPFSIENGNGVLRAGLPNSLLRSLYLKFISREIRDYKEEYVEGPKLNKVYEDFKTAYKGAKAVDWYNSMFTPAWIRVHGSLNDILVDRHKYSASQREELE